MATCNTINGVIGDPRRFSYGGQLRGTAIGLNDCDEITSGYGQAIGDVAAFRGIGNAGSYRFNSPLTAFGLRYQYVIPNLPGQPAPAPCTGDGSFQFLRAGVLQFELPGLDTYCGAFPYGVYFPAFAGVIAPPSQAFDEVRIRLTQSADEYIFGMPYVSAIPEPATLVLFGTGALALAGVTYRRRRR